MISALLIRLVYVLAGAVVGGISGACAARWMRGLDHIRVTVRPDADPQDVAHATNHRGEPIHTDHPSRTGP